MSENTLDPMLDLLASGNPLATSPTRTSPRKRKADPKPAPPPIQKKNWMIDEDKALCNAWLYTTRDSIVGNGQKSETFWERIHQHYAQLIEDVNKEKKKVKSFNPISIRSASSVECCWGHILKFVNKFIGFYSQCEDRLKSGQTRDQILSEAKELFKNQCRMRYNLDHCYIILKDTSKFQAARDEVNAREMKAKTPKLKQTRTVPNTPSTSANRGSSPVVVDVEDDDHPQQSILGSERLEGQKAAKKKRADEESMGKIVHMQKELVQLSRERLETMKSAVQDAADEIVLSKDLDKMDEQKRAYYERKLQLIYEREDAKEAEEKKKMDKEKVCVKEQEIAKAKAEEEAQATAEEAAKAKAKAHEREKAKKAAAKKKQDALANIDLEDEVECQSD
ncbi:hypothetical protein PSTG_09455 [Puccinia striiformis f. sp. tritici PST-78]|uniref:No apical meristem-associated C-terminal domain-containing protein n=1 Tax=Puccinia striiformis f. sp. tritici PST-78 TaxID=1165861 RepID=A0A0L0VD27_9BASI|nr:hypothetical protein PSTG_09455 [Puccinia striiformis f. sp. tritici PST-78]